MTAIVPRPLWLFVLGTAAMLEAPFSRSPQRLFLICNIVMLCYWTFSSDYILTVIFSTRLRLSRFHLRSFVCLDILTFINHNPRV